MLKIATDDIIEKIDEVISDESKFAELIRFVGEYFYGDDDIVLDNALELIYPVLFSYLDFVDSYGDENKMTRLRRLKEILMNGKALNDKIIFTLEDDEFDVLIEGRGMKKKEKFKTKIRKPIPNGIDLVEQVIFALEFEEIKQLCVKYNQNKFDDNVLDQQLGKLYPISFDVEKIKKWGFSHLNDDSLVISKLV